MFWDQVSPANDPLFDYSLSPDAVMRFGPNLMPRSLEGFAVGGHQAEEESDNIMNVNFQIEGEIS